MGSGAFWERGPERGGSAGCKFGSGPEVTRERGERGGSTNGRERGGEVDSEVRECVGERGSGTLLLGARFRDAPAQSTVRGSEPGGGTVRQPRYEPSRCFTQGSPKKAIKHLSLNKRGPII
jgi:hypothetical protein